MQTTLNSIISQKRIGICIAGEKCDKNKRIVTFEDGNLKSSQLFEIKPSLTNNFSCKEFNYSSVLTAPYD